VFETRPQALPDGAYSGVHSVAFSPDGRLLTACSGQRTVRLWDLTTGRTVRDIDGETAVGMALSPDSRLLATASHFYKNDDDEDYGGYGHKGVQLWEILRHTVPETFGVVTNGRANAERRLELDGPSSMNEAGRY